MLGRNLTFEPKLARYQVSIDEHHEIVTLE